ncbi:MAG: hypothetical protein H7Y41_06185, partial [Hyphomonadaceae bacterium]|nr:hypothetical protein [Clostridia bacterium]
MVFKNSKLKKCLAMVLVVTFLCSSFMVANATPVTNFSSIVSGVSPVYNFIASEDTDKFATPISAVTALGNAPTNAIWTSVLKTSGKELLTPAVITKFGTEAAAKAALARILTRIEKIYLCNSDNALTTQLNDWAANDTDLRTLLGNTFTMQEWFEYLLYSKRDTKLIATKLDKLGWINNTRTQVIKSLDDLQVATMNTKIAATSSLGTAFTSIGWTSANLISQLRVLANASDA